MTLAYLHYDVFTPEALAGNQLAVFLDGTGLDDARMQAIAREMAFSETTFIGPADRLGVDVRMRIFTPATELPMAGHPTVGSAFALAHGGMIAPGRTRVTFGLGIGPTPVDLEWQGSRLRFAWMTQLLPTFSPPLEHRAAVAAAIGLTVDDLAPGWPVQVVSCGVPYLLAPLRDRAAVDRATSDGRAIRALGASVFLFSVSPPSSPDTIYSRMFAAQGLGIVEDPATGSASGPVGAYLVQHRIVEAGGAGAESRIVSLQGVAMKRPSRIHIEVSGVPDALTRVRIGGEAVLVGEGTLRW